MKLIEWTFLNDIEISIKNSGLTLKQLVNCVKNNSVFEKSNSQNS